MLRAKPRRLYRPMAGSFLRRQIILVCPKVVIGRPICGRRASWRQAVARQHQGVRTMRYNRNPDVNKRGAANRRTLRRRYRMPADAAGTSVPIEKMNMLQRIRYVSNYCFALAESERRKGNRADVMVVFELMQAGAMLAAKAAPYVHPKLARDRARGVSQPQSATANRLRSYKKLTDEEFAFLESLTMKYKRTTPERRTRFRSPR